jgi:hypothetical protein
MAFVPAERLDGFIGIQPTGPPWDDKDRLLQMASRTYDADVDA